MAEGSVQDTEQNQLLQAWASWIKHIIGEDEWAKRCSDTYRFVAEKASKTTWAEMMESHVPKDVAAWHIYLCDTYLHDQLSYNLFQGARVIPAVLALIRDGFPISGIRGAEERVKNSIAKQPGQFEACMFELLVASAYARQGWSVEFMPETRTGPQPDIKVGGPEGELLVECKRKSRVSDYAEKERTRWLALYQPVRRLLVSQRLPQLLNVSFHIPLISLGDSYLYDRIASILARKPNGVVIDDEELTVEVRQLDLGPLQRHLRHNSVRLDSGLFNHLLFGDIEQWRSFSHIISAKRRVVGNAVFVDRISWAAGALWSCDALGSINAKARHLKRELAEAVGQFPDGVPAAVHWGIDVYDGESISAEIRRKTFETTDEFDPGQKDLRWVYCHLFEAWVPPDKNWDFKETCHYVRMPASPGWQLNNPLLIAPPAN